MTPVVVRPAIRNTFFQHLTPLHAEELLTVLNTVMKSEGGVKLENLWNKKAKNQLCWLTTHKGW